MDRRGHLIEAFRARYGAEPSIWTRAPGRVDLMGSHTDYNLGHVLTLRIDRDTWVAAQLRADRIVRVWSLDLDRGDTFAADDAIERAETPDTAWANYVRGVAATLLQDGRPIGGVDAVVQTTIPLGSGLSSSAALECAFAVLFRAAGGWALDADRMATLCQRAENGFVGVPCGILDQYTAAVGQGPSALLLDCRTQATRPVPMAPDLQVVVCDTRAPRTLAASEYTARRSACEEAARELGVSALAELTPKTFVSRAGSLPAPLARRARFVIQEHGRVAEMAAALTAGDRAAVGTLTAASFNEARDLFEVVTPPMTAMRDAMAAAPGFIGGRQSGAGFGGCLTAIVDRNDTAAFVRSVAGAYEAASGVTPDVYPVEGSEPAGLLP